MIDINYIEGRRLPIKRKSSTSYYTHSGEFENMQLFEQFPATSALCSLKNIINFKQKFHRRSHIEQLMQVQHI